MSEPLALTLFDVTTIPSRKLADPTLALQGERWCTGSGVPGDNCEFGHEIEAEWADEAWRPEGGARDTSRAMCTRCEQTRRNYKDSLQDGDEAKARAWLSDKAQKYAKIWKITAAEARHRFELHGVTLEYMTRLFRDARRRGTCPAWYQGGCGEHFAPGPHDITGDIKDPIDVAERGYLTCDDIHAQCFTCNRAKGPKRWKAWLRRCAFFEYCAQYKPPGQQTALG